MYNEQIVPDGTVISATITIPFHGAKFPSDAEFLDLIITAVGNATSPTLQFQYQVWNNVTRAWVNQSTTSGLNAIGTTTIGMLSGNQTSAPYGEQPSQIILTLGGTAVSSTVAAGSNGGEISAIATWSSPSAGVLDIASIGSGSAAFPSTGGTVTVAASGSTTAIVNYTGTATGQLTGCTYVSGSATGTVATSGAVTLSPSPSFTLGIHKRG
jgi:hypothetical protein